MAEWLDLRKVPLPKAQDIINRTFMFYGVQDVTALVEDQQTAQGLAQLMENREFVVEVGEQGGDYYLNVHKTTFIKPSLGREISFVLLLGSTTLGQGDSELGKKLLSGLLDGLTQVESLPTHLVLYNEAVTLAARNSPLLIHLQQLAALGCDILVSGESLEQYGTVANLALGYTINTLHLAEIISQAAKVVAL